MRSLKVPLDDRSYVIRIGPGLLALLGLECSRLGLAQHCAIITDQKVGPLYLRATRASLRASGVRSIVITVPAGERSKSLAALKRCFDSLASGRLERSGFIVALGGGVVGDLAGFAAATWLRGVPFVQVPTTLLAQVDSSVGGKVGINLESGKNLVGAFHQPRLVLCDLDTLLTLPEREYRSGLAEVIKYGVIQDRDLFELLERKIDRLNEREDSVLESVIERCCKIKSCIVERDELDQGLRAVLNFGHTIGHALEAVSGYGRYLHGEAIALGQVAAAWLSNQMLGLSDVEMERIRALLERAGLPTHLRLDATVRKKLIAAMTLDKKVAAGKVRFVLVPRIGHAQFGQTVDRRMILKALGALAAQDRVSDNH